MIDQADYVIVGGGAAGCVLANRLSEDPRRNVVLLEAGGTGGGMLRTMPVGSYLMLGKPEYDWIYQTEPDPSLNGRQSVWSAGRTLGGGSAINGMVYIRGARSDYDSLVSDFGCAGWGWDDVLPYFQKSEDYSGPPAPSHKTGGPLGVSLPRKTHPLSQAFVDACSQFGLRAIADYCDGDIDGTFINLVTQRDGKRSSAEHAFLGKAMKRSNLKVIAEALVDKILLDGHRAIGVRYVKDGANRELRAACEVIVSASTLQSPAILMRSGIGPGSALRSMGIKPVVEAPEVGRNLQEHASVQTSYFVDVPTYNSMIGGLRMPRNLLQYLILGKGPLSATPVEAMAYLHSQPGLAHPDIKLQFGPLVFDPQTRGPHERPGVVVYANVAKPKSRGEIRLRSADPTVKPVIDHRLLGSPDDVTALIRGLRQVDQIFRQPALMRHLVGRISPSAELQTDAEWEERIRSTAGIGYHPVGTCRMGSDAASVVDPQLRVRGIEGLRVADASIMPAMPCANTNGPAIMIGEKAADLIKADS